MSQENDQQGDDLDPTWLDYATTVIRSAVGLVPIAGTFLQEIVNAIPRQRFERVVDFLRRLNEKVLKLEITSNEYHAQLISQGAQQASDAVSADRRQRIADLVANGLEGDGFKIQDHLFLLKVLGELSDVQVVMLMAFAHDKLKRWHAFSAANTEVFASGVQVDEYYQPVFKNEISTAYLERLVASGLLEKFAVDAENRNILSNTASENQYYRLTPLAKRLLVEIDAIERAW